MLNYSQDAVNIYLRSEQNGMIRVGDIAHLVIDVGDDIEALNIKTPITALMIGEECREEINMVVDDLSMLGINVLLGEYGFVFTPNSIVPYDDCSSYEGVTAITYRVEDWLSVVPVLIVDDGVDESYMEALQELYPAVSEEDAPRAKFEVFARVVESGIQENTIEWSA